MTRHLRTFAALAASIPVVMAAQTPPAAPARPPFVDVTKAARIDFVHEADPTPEKFMYETFGSGVAWLDFDSDGRQDLFFVNGKAGSSNALYRNNGDGTFANVTARSGLAGRPGDKTTYRTGVGVGDFNNDGRPDLYVTAYGPNTLYRNNGDGTFTDVTTAAGVAGGPNEWSTSTGFFDADRDGDLDLYVVNYLDYRREKNPYCGYQRDGYRMYCQPQPFDGLADRLFRNNGNGTFTDVSKAAGIANPAGKGLGVAFCDFDQDGHIDVYVANDMVRNFLYRNNGNGTFRDVAYGAGAGFASDGKPRAGMGTDCADIDGNWMPDIFVTNFSEELNTLFMNQGNGLFEDRTTALGLGSGFLPLGFGTKLFDLENDGDLDIYVTNGHVVDNVKLYRSSFSYAQKALLYRNGGSGKFTDISAASGPALQLTTVGRGLAVSDYDDDGQLDIVVTGVNSAPILLKNQAGGSNRWLKIAARGKTSNRFGLGARVRIETPALTQVREINNVASYQSANDVRLHVGLGNVATVPRIEIRWPSGKTQVLTNVASNQVLTVDEP